MFTWLSENWWIVLLVAGILLLLVLVYLFLVRPRLAKKKEDQEEQPETDDAEPSDKKDPDVVGIRTSFEKQLKRLKEYVPKSTYRYQIPWYLLVGEEGSGKSTLLENIGLPLPLGPPTDMRRRNVNWWFFQEAVILDVPGDYLLAKETEATRDLLWSTLLRQLQFRRRRRPIDGVVLTVPCTDFYGPDALTPEALEHKADLVYQKLLAAQRVLGLRFPIYVLFTQCDCIPSFQGYIHELPQEYRETIFGWSSPYSVDAAYTDEWIDVAFDALGETLYRSHVELMADGMDSDDPDGFFIFPTDFQEIRDNVGFYLNRLFRPSAYHDAYDLRGIYFTGDDPEIEEEVPDLEELFSGDGAQGPVPTLSEEPPGDEEDPELMSAPPAYQAHPIFLTDLFSKKIFPEFQLARPISQKLLYGHRTARALQIASLLIFLIWGIGLIFAYSRLNNGKEARIEILTDIRDGVAEQGVGSETAISNEGVNKEKVSDLLDQFAALDARKLNSFFIPQSWFSPVDTRIEKAYAIGYEGYVLPSIKQALDMKADSLILHYSPALTRGAASADSLYELADTLYMQGNALIERRYADVSIAADSANQLLEQAEFLFARADTLLTRADFLSSNIDGYDFSVGPPLSLRDQPPFKKLQNYVNDMVDLEAKGLLYNTLQTTQDLGNLETLMMYVYDKEMPPGFQEQSAEYREALGRIRFTSDLHFVPASYQATAGPVADSLVITLYRSLFYNNALSRGLETLEGSLIELDDVERRLRADPVSSREELERGQEAIRNVRLLVGNRALSYLNPPTNPDLFLNLDSLDAPFYDVLDAMRNSDFFDEEPYVFMVNEGMAMRNEARALLVQRQSNRTGPLIDAEEGALRLSDGVENFDALLKTLLALTQFQARGPIPGGIPFGNSLHWNVEMLRQAADPVLTDAEQQLGAVDERSEQSLLEAKTINLIRRSVEFRTKDQEAFILNHPDLLRAQIGNFEDASGEINRVLSKFQAWNAESALTSLSSLTSQQALYLLGLVDALLERRQLYALRGNPTGWSGGPLYSTLLNTEDENDVAVYLATENAAMQDLATTFAKPLVSFLAPDVGANEQNPLVTKWQAIVTQVDAYETGSTMKRLEDFLREVLVVSTAEACLDVVIKEIPVGTDYFLQRYRENKDKLLSRCRNLSERNAETGYIALQKEFTEFLSGKTPFSSPVAQIQGDVYLPRVRRFLTNYRQYAARSSRVIANNPERFDPRMREFVARMEVVSAFFTAMEDAALEEEAPPQLDFDVDFRVDKEREIRGSDIISWQLIVGGQTFDAQGDTQTGTWSYNDPVYLVLRWAKDGPRTPLQDPNEPSMRVVDKSARYEYRNAWAMLSFLDRNRFTQEVSDLVTLEFRIPTRSIDGSVGETKVYIQLTLRPHESQNPLELPAIFPSVAPALPAGASTSSQ